MPVIKYLNLNGIPSDHPRQDRNQYLWRLPDNSWSLSHGDMSYEVDIICVCLSDAISRSIVEAPLLPFVPQFVSISGLNSESPLSKLDFEKFVRLMADFPGINRFLFLYDVQKLISSIQECQNEIIHMVGEFYLTLNTEPLFSPPISQEAGTVYYKSPIVTKLFALLTFIFIRMHSLLDYTVKLALEVECLPTDFTKYPKMKSTHEQFRSRKKVSFNNQPGTLFEDCEFITMVETLRNHLIHDGLLDDLPKVYERIENGVAVERFLLLPDMTDGRFDRYGNRNLFFSREYKINERLPEIVAEFQKRLIETLSEIMKQVQH